MEKPQNKHDFFIFSSIYSFSFSSFSFISKLFLFYLVLFQFNMHVSLIQNNQQWLDGHG